MVEKEKLQHQSDNSHATEQQQQHALANNVSFHGVREIKNWNERFTVHNVADRESMPFLDRLAKMAAQRNHIYQ